MRYPNGTLTALPKVRKPFDFLMFLAERDPGRGFVSDTKTGSEMYPKRVSSTPEMDFDFTSRIVSHP